MGEVLEVFRISFSKRLMGAKRVLKGLQWASGLFQEISGGFRRVLKFKTQ